MNLAVIDIVCAIAFAAGIAIAVKGAASTGAPPPKTYITRIVGVMIAVFALTLGTIFTVFNLS